MINHYGSKLDTIDSVEKEWSGDRTLKVFGVNLNWITAQKVNIYIMAAASQFPSLEYKLVNR